jgi:hypothetical protein
MVWTSNISVRYHQQDNERYCGAAVSQMVRNTNGSGIIDQAKLFNDSQVYMDPATWGTGWGMDPECVKHACNGGIMSINGRYRIIAMEDLMGWTARVIKIFCKYSKPIPILVYKNAEHWVLVQGVKLANAPGNIIIPMSILGIYIHNPWPPVPSYVSTSYNPPPPPHSDQDSCGMGNNNKLFGVPNQYIVYNGQWFKDYILGTVFKPGGKALAVAVCYADDIMLKPGRYDLREEIMYKKKIGPSEIIELVPKEIENHDLLNDELFSKALKKAEPQEPVLVRRLHRVNSYYYLVPMKKSKNITAVIAMDALSGTLDGCMAYPKPVPKLFMSKDEVKKRMAGRSIHFPGKKNAVVLEEGTFDVQKDLVWKPCKESLSPYYPLHAITTIGDREIYVDYLGNVHTELHDEGPFG